MVKVSIAEENVMPFYDALGSAHFKLQSRVLEEYGKLKLDIYFKSIGFVTTVTSVIGIIAGFGFTAFAFVESKLLFFTGEAILFYGIFRGLKWAQDVYSAEFKALVGEIQKHLTHYEIRNAAFKIVFDQLLLPSHEIELTDIDKLQRLDQDSLALFEPNKENKKPLVIYSREVYISLLLGAAVLFSSFFVLDLVKFFAGLIR